MQNNNLMNITGKVNVLKTVPYALQQVLAMFVTNLVPLWTIVAVSAEAISPDLILALQQNSMIIAGIATLIQATPIWKIGSGLPIYMGVSFTFIITLSQVSGTYGFSAVMGAVIVGGFLEGILGLTAKYWKRIIAPIVSATVVMGIGLSLLSSASQAFGGGQSADFGSIPNLVTGTVTVVSCILWQVFTRGPKRPLSILIGLIAGYITALCFGIVDFSDMSGMQIIALPRFLPLKPVFRLDAILPAAIIYLVSTTETIGDTTALASGALHRNATPEEISGSLAIDGFGSMLGGFFGVPPVTSFSENVGLTIMTGVVNRNVARIGAVILIFCGLFPPVGRFMQTLPSSAIGGVLIVVLGQITVSGCQMVSEAGFTTRNKLIASLSLATGIGFTASSGAGIWNSFPAIIQSIFAQNAVAVIFVMALFLNLVLPKDMEEKTTGGEHGNEK